MFFNNILHVHTETSEVLQRSFPPLFWRSVASVTSSLSPLIAMINAENSARRCSSTTQVAVPAGLSHVTLHSRATLSPYRNQPAKTEHMAYFPSAGHNSWDVSFDALACFDLPCRFLNYCVETLMRFYCDKEAWEINKCPLDHKCYINKRAVGSNGILKNVGELT